MAHKTPDGSWRVSVRVKGKRVTKKFPKGTPKGLVDDYERRLKLGGIDPSLVESKKAPLLRDFFQEWVDKVGIEWTLGFVRKRNQEFRDHIGPILGSFRLSEIEARDIRNLSYLY